ncbi:unnamed protein product [Lymnaea stagnalis]|uniref:ATPase AAA-type core domain-containing protein n=1 Tax=Lymnaea stagnalis TaxID=6523 RepID=A0AAV2HVY9_LYMST
MGPKKAKGAKKAKKKVKKPAAVKTTTSFYWNIQPPVPINAYHNRQWHEVQSDINRLLAEENSMFFNKKGQPKDPKPIKDREKAFQFCVVRYVRYIMIAKRLDECYQFMVHPQKRQLVRTCISGIITRILELKELMVEIEEREFHFFDDVLQDLQLTPDQVEMNIPRFYRDERLQVLQNREHILESILKKIDADNSFGEKAAEELMSKEHAIMLVQRHLRAYVGRLKHYKLAWKVSQLKNNHTLMRKAADAWACYVYKCKTRRIRQVEHQFLGMLTDETYDANVEMQKREEHFQRNQRKMDENWNDYEFDKTMTEEDIIDTEGPGMAENLKYNILQWLLETKNLMGTFPEFPTEEMGGSSLLFSNKSIKQVEEEIRDMFEDNKSKKKDNKKKEAKKEPKKGKEDPNEYKWIMPRSQVLPVLTEEKDEYMKYWFYKDDAENIHQKHDKELMKEAIKLNIAEKIRIEVDKLIRFELENMKIVIEQAVKAKAKKKKGKGGRNKKGKKGRKKGRRDGKDLTKDRSMDDLYEELVQNDIIKRVPQVSLSSFLGDYCYTGSCTQESELNPLPSLADVRRLVTEFAILPLGSTEVHQLAPLNRSMLIAGVRGTGKKMLVNAICHEAGANLFDISPANLYGKYDSKAGMNMIMHLIMKVGKALEPSVFWVDQCDKMFLKKKDKFDLAKPHKWIKILKKTMKKIKNGDRMMFIGTCKRPSLCKQKPLSKCFKRTVLIPVPDYGSRYLIWQHFIGTMAGLSNYELENMDFSSLTKV